VVLLANGHKMIALCGVCDAVYIGDVNNSDLNITGS